jgi:hypothetical protein
MFEPNASLEGQQCPSMLAKKSPASVSGRDFFDFHLDFSI